IRVKMTGSLTYKGSDLLMEAALDGALVIDAAGTHLVEIPFQFDGDRQPASTIPRMVRGADPWVAGQTREFRLETLPLSEAFCEFVPHATTLFVVLNTFGARDGKQALPVAAVPIHFEELIGMAMDSQVQLISETGFIPAAGHVTLMDKMMVTLLDGTTKWVSRDQVAYLNGITRGPGAVFPKAFEAGPWLISVKGITSQREFEDVSPRGEDSFVALIEVSITNKGEDALPVEAIRMRLEAAPNDWRKPLAVGLGKPGERKLATGESIDGTVAFIRYRFERPSRLKVDVEGAGSVYVNVFSYDIGPERSPVRN
ncbi:MAG: hypothetical protein JXX14_06940, partial [Deltaproteobacteria bacterium]|nr:hypothetical protein [Deltaproteobacteria bacterium]